MSGPVQSDEAEDGKLSLHISHFIIQFDSSEHRT